MNLRALHLATSDEYGVHFETGVPVTFRFLRNTEGAPNFGARFGQDIEPAGRYMLHNPDPGRLSRGWEAGGITFENPLVLELSGDMNEIYGPHGWKARLHAATGKKGEALSRYLASQGFDGIVTVDDTGYTREIVDMTRYTAKNNPPRTYRIQKVAAKLERSAVVSFKPGSVVSRPEDVILSLADYIGENATESFITLHLNVRNGIIGFTEFNEGAVAGVGVNPAGIFRDALLTAATGIVTVHNHPTGNPSPSDEDRALWRRLRAAGDVVGVPVIDNLIIGERDFYSESSDSTTPYTMPARSAAERKPR